MTFKFEYLGNFWIYIRKYTRVKIRGPEACFLWKKEKSKISSKCIFKFSYNLLSLMLLICLSHPIFSVSCQFSQHYANIVDIKWTFSASASFNFWQPALSQAFSVSCRPVQSRQYSLIVTFSVSQRSFQSDGNFLSRPRPTHPAKQAHAKYPEG